MIKRIIKKIKKVIKRINRSLDKGLKNWDFKSWGNPFDSHNGS
jgi:hypothetical protein